MKRLVLATLAFSALAGAQTSPYPARVAQKVFVPGTGENDKLAGGMVGMGVGKDGRVYILERLLCTVKVFEATGKFVRKFGTAGTGNGQCSRPIALQVTDTSIVITDGPSGPPPAQGRLIVFSYDGKARSTTPAAVQGRGDMARPQETPGREMRGGSRVFVGTTMSAQGKRMLAVTVQAAAAEARDTLFTYAMDFANITRTGGRSGPGPSGFGNAGAHAFSGDSILIHADGISGSVTWFTFSAKGAERARTASMGIAATAITAQDVTERANQMASVTPVMVPPDPNAAADAAGAGGGRGGRGGGRGGDEPAAPRQMMAPGSITIANAPDLLSVASEILLSADGAVWVSNIRRETYRTASAEEPYFEARTMYTVFPPAGDPYVVRLPVGFFVRSVIGDRVYGSVTGSHAGAMVYSVEAR